MKANVLKPVLFALIVLFAVTENMAQRVITGTVYREGKPAAGITVEAHKGGSMMTSFDGIYKVDADAKSKWIKFTFIDDTKKLDIEDNSSNQIDFYFDGVKPAATNKSGKGVILKSAEELLREKNKEFMNELSLYSEFYKQKDYKSAQEHWKKLYARYPKSTLNIYLHGVNMCEDAIEKATNWDEKNKHIQRMLEIYDQRIKYFDQEGFVQGRKGTSLLKYTREVDDLSLEEQKEILKSGYDCLEKSAKMQGVETELPVLVLLMQTTRTLFKMEELPKEKVIENYDFINGILNKVLANNPDAEQEEKTKEAATYVEQMFGTSGAADCEALISIFAPQFKEKGDDIDFIKNMLRRLNRANCNESELFSTATEKMYELDPSAEAAFNMARRFLKKEEPEKAKEYYLQAIDQETDEALKADYLYEFAAFKFAQEKNLQEARNYAKRALALNDKHCKALMLIGDIYVAASRSFGADNFEKSSVFWVAVDYFTRARNAGEDCYGEAAGKISTYRAYFPNKEEGFFRGLTEGGAYKVEGWINENTRVRY